MTKTVIIGSNHAGIAAGNILLDKYNQEVVMIERNSNFSYLSCGTALWVGRQIDEVDGLFYTNRDDFEAKGAKVYLETTVDHIDFEKKEVHSVTASGEELVETYDKLILATGSVPISPKVPGNDLKNITFMKKFQEGQFIDNLLESDEIQNIAVIGAGYIGVEMAEAAKRRGKNVLLFDAADRSLPSYYDPEFTDAMDKNLADHGIELHLGELVQEYRGTDKVETVVTEKGEYAADLVINAIGFLPNSELGKDELDLFVNGAYLVDRHQRTSNPDVYAVGDCATVYSNALQDTAYIALATNAVRTGMVAGENIGGNEIESPGVQGSNGISIFGYNMVSTGYSVTAAPRFGLDVKYTDFEDTQKPGFMHDNHDVKIRIVYDANTRRIVGAQMASTTSEISMAIHMFSLAIERGVTIDELALLDLFFLPHFNQPYNYINKAALAAE
ncbi:FAD-dependent oxidoreductase [Enterococcus saccharolyticus]|uniref:NADH oxidase n=1 Tax=Candidatus Enterococcus willemsii TaxID=1857215 RepID=A0ABQ6YW25_9ENTE|nr:MULTISPECIES: FAD-dependent oxidoreductase [Enterococcus]KAF1301906.1 NADH oxidase [Enterococcus sp. CU12B]MCD5003462.1 FAD-dependent oxidoreductase [Enterococcus saccharolyticus]